MRTLEGILIRPLKRTKFGLNMYCEIQKLYAIERKAKENMLTHKERLAIRQELSVPILSEMHQWLKINITSAATKPDWKSIGLFFIKVGKINAVLYRWSAGNRYNLVENAVWSCCYRKKNYSFAGSHDAAQRAAMIYSCSAPVKCEAQNLFPG
ncbi:MAG: transposase [Bacteroidetes bacterium]|nr:transposase [Bacteroidota bacterium]